MRFGSILVSGYPCKSTLEGKSITRQRFPHSLDEYIHALLLFCFFLATLNWAVHWYTTRRRKAQRIWRDEDRCWRGLPRWREKGDEECSRERRKSVSWATPLEADTYTEPRSERDEHLSEIAVSALEQGGFSRCRCGGLHHDHVGSSSICSTWRGEKRRRGNMV